MRLQDITINMYYGMNKDFFPFCLTGLTLWSHPAISTAVTVSLVRCTRVTPTVVWTAFVTVLSVHTAPFTACVLEKKEFKN